MANLLLIELEEPNIALIAEDYSPRFLQLAEERGLALQRYQALMGVMLSQLVGLVDCHIRFVVSPADGVEAVKFWLLSELRGQVQQSVDHVEQIFEFIPEQNAPTITLEFSSEMSDNASFPKIAKLNPYCIACGSRWINLAFLQCKENHSVVGDGYLTVEHQKSDNSKETLKLPELEIVDSDKAWHDALGTHLSGKMMMQLEKISLNHS